MTLYEVPSIAINTVSKRLNETDLKPKKKGDQEKAERMFKNIVVSEVECFASDDRIKANFKDKWVQSFKDITKY